MSADQALAAAKIAKADARTIDLLPVIREIRAAGLSTMAAIGTF
jgi:hypothetical protein